MRWGAASRRRRRRRPGATWLCRGHEAAAAGIPFCIIHGDQDKLVPLEPNSARLTMAYEAAGKAELVTLFVAEGQGHSFWEGFFQSRELVDFLVDRAQAGAAR